MKIVVAILVVVIVALVAAFVPLVEAEFRHTETFLEDEPYEVTETYYVDEPYVVREEYTEVEEQTFTRQKNAVLMDKLFIPTWGSRTFQTHIDISGKSNCLVKGWFMPQLGSPVLDFYIYDYTDPSRGVGTPQNPIVAIGSVSRYTFSFVPMRSGIYYFRFECYLPVVRTGFEFKVEMEWQETVVQTREVTKYRDVTKYRQVEKERTVTEYRQVEKERLVTHYERVPIFEYLRSRFQG